MFLLAALIQQFIMLCQNTSEIIRSWSKQVTGYRTWNQKLISLRFELAPPCQLFDDGRKMLRADYSVNCDSAEHSRYQLLAKAVMVYPAGTLVLYWAVLARNRKLLYPLEVRRRPREDKAIALEAKRGNRLQLRPFVLLHDACECHLACCFPICRLTTGFLVGYPLMVKVIGSFQLTGGHYYDRRRRLFWRLKLVTLVLFGHSNRGLGFVFVMRPVSKAAIR